MNIYRIHQPNDKLFKKAMEEIEVAKEFFTAHLPMELLRRIDLNTLKLEKETSTSSKYKAFAADVVYSVKFDNKLAYLYTLVENQHEPDEWLPFRIMIYIFALLEYHCSQKQTLPLPPVIPIIFYTGKRKYPYSTSFFDLFGEESLLMAKLLNEPIQIIEVQQIEDETLKKRMLSGIIEYILKHKRGKRFFKLEELFIWLGKLAKGNAWRRRYVQNLVYYVLAETEGKELTKIMYLAEKCLSGEVKEQTMTYAEQLIELGRNEGIEKGRLEGRQEGRLEGVMNGRITLLKNLLQRKFPKTHSVYLKKLDHADENLLLKWAERLLSAQSCEEVFAD
jgi:predicted transposase YdaD